MRALIFAIYLLATPTAAQIVGAKCDGVTDDSAAIQAALKPLSCA